MEVHIISQDAHSYCAAPPAHLPLPDAAGVPAEGPAVPRVARPGVVPVSGCPDATFPGERTVAAPAGEVAAAWEAGTPVSSRCSENLWQGGDGGASAGRLDCLPQEPKQSAGAKTSQMGPAEPAGPADPANPADPAHPTTRPAGPGTHRILVSRSSSR